MNKLDTNHRDSSLVIANTSLPNASTAVSTPTKTRQLSIGPIPACRLIVLIPAEADYNATMHRVWELANATGARVQLLGLCKDVAQESGLRRGLTTMSALVRDGRVSVEVKVEIGSNWVNAIRRNYQAGDMIVCFAEQRAGLWHKPLSQILESNLKAPVYILSGLSLRKTESNWLMQAIAWLGSIGIIVGFAILQVRIVQLPKDWFQNVLLILLLIPEYRLIVVWNSLFG